MLRSMLPSIKTHSCHKYARMSCRTPERVITLTCCKCTAGLTGQSAITARPPPPAPRPGAPPGAVAAFNGTASDGQFNPMLYLDVLMEVRGSPGRLKDNVTLTVVLACRAREHFTIVVGPGSQLGCVPGDG